MTKRTEQSELFSALAPITPAQVQGLMAQPDTVPNPRRTDPITSVKGAADAAPRAAGQQMKALEAYYDAGEAGMTAYEMGQASGLSVNPSCCYWRRASSLLDKGLIRAHPDGTERVNPDSGSMQRVCQITALGYAAVEAVRQ